MVRSEATVICLPWLYNRDWKRGHFAPIITYNQCWSGSEVLTTPTAVSKKSALQFLLRLDLYSCLWFARLRVSLSSLSLEVLGMASLHSLSSVG